jgi:hypothetical protein
MSTTNSRQAMIKKFFIAAIAVGLSHLVLAQSPNCVSSVELAGLNVGMTKMQVVEALGGTYPFDVLSGDYFGCEVYHYMYKKPKKKSKMDDLGRVILTEGRKTYVEPSDAYLVFREGLLSLVVTDIGWDDAMALVKELDSIRSACQELDIRGCTDDKALNYKADAVIDDGLCEYPPCGYELNPKFNPKRPVSESNTRFIYVESLTTINIKEPEQCSDCEIIEKLVNGNANIDLTLKLDSNGRVKYEEEKKKSSGGNSAPAPAAAPAAPKSGKGK